MRCFDLISEEGTINNATFPAAIGWAPISAGWATSNLVAECLGRMLDTSVELRPRVQSVCTGSYDTVTLAGINQRGMPSVGLLFDAMAGGYGARPDGDGADTAGILPIPMGRAPDVEMQEFLAPYLFLWRREEQDSGGAGQSRGGLSISICLVPHGTPAPLAAAFSVNGKARAESSGLAGACPGGAAHDLVVRDTDVARLLAAGVIPGSLDELGGHRELVQNRTETLVGLADAIFMHPSGGGGYGDPLLRDPGRVAVDVQAGKVSAAVAGDVYGVVLDPQLAADHAATEKSRAEIRRSRAGSEVTPITPQPASAETGIPVDANLAILRDADEQATAICLALPAPNRLVGIRPGRRYRHPGQSGARVGPRDARRRRRLRGGGPGFPHLLLPGLRHPAAYRDRAVRRARGDAVNSADRGLRRCSLCR